MTLVQSPCQNCGKRYPGCHAECQSYTDFKTQLEEARNQYDLDMEYDNYFVTVLTRNRQAINKLVKRGRKVFSALLVIGAILAPTRVSALNVCEPTDYSAHYEPWVQIGAELIDAEARGVESLDEQAAVLWCAYNRVIDPRFPNDLVDVIRQPGQFASLANTNPTDQMYQLSADVFFRFCAEQNGEEEVGRTLPDDYFFFAGDGRHNHFRKEYKSEGRWDWSSPVYEGEKHD